MNTWKPVPGAGVANNPPPLPTKVYLFIDDSNLYIQGQYTAKRRYPADPSAQSRFRLNYRRFVEWALNGRTLESVYLVGSSSPQAKPFWQSLSAKGIVPVVHDRQFGGEKGVDHDIVAEMVETSILRDKHDAVIALVAGDGDYRTTMDRLSRKGWNLEVYFWKLGCASLLRETEWYVELDPHFNEFCFFEKDVAIAANHL